MESVKDNSENFMHFLTHLVPPYFFLQNPAVSCWRHDMETPSQTPNLMFIVLWAWISC